MVTHAPPVERFYDPADLDPSAPRLRVMRNGDVWVLEDDAGTRLSTHCTRDSAIDAALERSARRFSEILVRSSTGRGEWVIDQNPELLRLVDSPAEARNCWPGTLKAAMAAGAHQLTFDPGEVDRDAPKLHVRREGDGWEIRSAAGVLSAHHTQEEALAAARSRVAGCGAEVFFESRSGRFLHRVARSPAELRFLELWQNIHDDHHELQE